MGGNSVGSTSRVTTVTPTTNPSQAKIDTLLKELTQLTDPERRDALVALKAAGLDDLATALKGVIGSGSRPAERPAPAVTYTPPA